MAQINLTAAQINAILQSAQGLTSRAPGPVSAMFKLEIAGGDATYTLTNSGAALGVPTQVFTAFANSNLPAANLTIPAEQYDMLKVWLHGAINVQSTSSGIALFAYVKNGSNYRNLSDDQGLVASPVALFETTATGVQVVDTSISARVLPTDIDANGMVTIQLYAMNVAGTGSQVVTFNGNITANKPVFSWGVDNLRTDRRRLLSSNYTDVASSALVAGDNYTILTIGGLDWTQVGAPSGFGVGTYFTAAKSGFTTGQTITFGAGGAAAQDNSWEGVGLASPAVWQDSNGLWNMLYQGGPRNPAIGWATATHPFGPWTKYAGNPVIGHGVLGLSSAATPGVLYENGLLYVYVVYGGDVYCYSGTSVLTMGNTPIKVFDHTQQSRLVGVANPYVVHVGNTYYLYFGSMDTSSNGYYKPGVAVATSPTGAFTVAVSGTYTASTGRWPITELAENFYANSGADWVAYTNVNGSGLWSMVYEACPLASNNYPTNFYTAHSTDGIHWVQSVVLTPIMQPLTNTFQYDQVANAELVNFAGDNYLFHAAARSLTMEGGIDVSVPSRFPLTLF